MNREFLHSIVEREAAMVWDTLCEVHPRLCGFDVPQVILDGRLWRCAGMCHQDDRLVKLGYKFFLHSSRYRAKMLDVILPHELIHQADFDLFGESDLKCGHGNNWKMLMLQFGLEPLTHHSMEIKR